MANTNNTPMKITAWHNPHGTNHPSQGLPCPTCNAAPGAPCTSTVGLARHGATGVPVTGLHAARVDAARKAAECQCEANYVTGLDRCALCGNTVKGAA